MLKSICIRCGAAIPYGSRCPCRAADKRVYDKRYDKQQRDAASAAVYHSKEWATVRAVAIARDNGLCLSCLSRQRIKACDTVHHIVEVKEDASRCYDLDNLICLCFRCHARVHKAYEGDRAGERERLYAMMGER